MTTVVEKRRQSGDSLLVICDFSPPRGSDPALLEPALHLGADFISMAYNPGRSARVSSPLAAHWVRERSGRDVVFTLATRDMNKVATQSLLMGASLLGLDNLIVVKGDSFSESDLRSVKSVDDFTPTGLIKATAEMGEGIDFRGRKLRSPSRFCVGATLDLGKDPNREMALARRKADAGAEFFLLQALFEPARLRRFVDDYSERYGGPLEQPIFCGVQVPAPDGLSFGSVPGWVSSDLAKGRPGDQIALQLIYEYRDAGFTSIYLVPPVFRGGRRDYEAAQRVLEDLER